MDAVSRRLLKELREIDREAAAHPEIIELAPESDDDLLKWKALLSGLDETPYEGETIHILIQQCLIE
jgi:peroxin-4